MNESSKRLDKYIEENGGNAPFVDFINAEPLDLTRTITVSPEEADAFVEYGWEFDREQLEALAGFGVRPMTVHLPGENPGLGLEVIPETIAAQIADLFPDNPEASVKAVHTALDDWLHGRLESNWGTTLGFPGQDLS